MTLLEFNNLFKSKLIARVDKNELDEFFFWLIDHFCNCSRMDYILNSSTKIPKTQEQNLKNSIDSLSLSGLKSDNKSIPLSKHSLHVPMKTYGMVECMHQVYLHLILDKFMNIEEWNKKDVQDMNASNFKL